MKIYFKINNWTTLRLYSDKSRIPRKEGRQPYILPKFPKNFLSWRGGGHASAMLTRNYPSFCFEIISRNGLSITGFYGSLATLSLVNGFRCVMEYMYCGFSE